MINTFYDCQMDYSWHLLSVYWLIEKYVYSMLLGETQLHDG